MRILVFGADGQLGQALRKVFGPRAIYSTRQDFDLIQNENIADYLARVAPDLIINASAFTHVDRAETEVELADLLNHQTPSRMSQWVALNNKKLIHISTDFVFDGKKESPYIESDSAGPLNIYGLSKWRGELAIRNSGACALILRTSWVYSELANNFVGAILGRAQTHARLNVVSDQIGSPTYALDLAIAIEKFITEDRLREAKGTHLFHVCGTGSCSRFEWAQEIIRLAQKFQVPLKANTVNPVFSLDYPSKVNRPLNSCLDQSNWLKSGGYQMPAWQISLERVIAIVAKCQRQ